MATLTRIVVTFDGSAVTGAASTSFYSLGTAAALQSAVAGLFGGLKILMPPTMNANVPGGGETIEDTSGDINGVWTAGTAGVHTGTGGQDYAAGVGCRLVWETGSRTRNRPCRGSTFIVPISAECFHSDGTLNSAVMESLTTSVNAFRSALGTDQVVWTRPQEGTENGGHATVVSGHPVDKTSWLRSRRT
jgi:hypothetical protein